jgi:hypothetical protein
MNPIIITGIFTILGVVIGSITTLTITVFNTRTDRQRQIRELGLQLALTNFQFFKEQASILAAKTHQKTMIPSLAIFVAEGIRMAEIVSNPKLNAVEISRGIADLSNFSKTIIRGENDSDKDQ